MNSNDTSSNRHLRPNYAQQGQSAAASEFPQQGLDWRFQGKPYPCHWCMRDRPVTPHGYDNICAECYAVGDKDRVQRGMSEEQKDQAKWGKRKETAPQCPPLVSVEFGEAMTNLARLFDRESQHAAGLVEMNQECIKDRDQARMDERSAARQLDKAVSLAAEAFHYQNRLPGDLVQRLSRFLASIPKQSAQQVMDSSKEVTDHLARAFAMQKQAQPTEEQANLQQLAGTVPAHYGKAGMQSGEAYDTPAQTSEPVRVLEGWRKADAARGIAAEHFVQVQEASPVQLLSCGVLRGELALCQRDLAACAEERNAARAQLSELEREQREDTVHRSNALAHVRRLENENIELHAALDAQHKKIQSVVVQLSNSGRKVRADWILAELR